MFNIVLVEPQIPTNTGTNLEDYVYNLGCNSTSSKTLGNLGNRG